MNPKISSEALKQVFTEARTHHDWTSEKVSDDVLRDLYETTKWGPTSLNAAPMRILFLKGNEAKEKLYPALMGSNVAQVKDAPITAVVAYDEKFYEYLPKLFPAFDARALFINNDKATYDTAFRNSSLQGAYLILAARALGLDAGPMSGFENAKVDEAFFKDSSWKSNFICTLGYGDHTKVYPRGPRLTFEEACKIV